MDKRTVVVSVIIAIMWTLFVGSTSFVLGTYADGTSFGLYALDYGNEANACLDELIASEQQMKERVKEEILVRQDLNLCYERVTACAEDSTKVLEREAATLERLDECSTYVTYSVVDYVKKLEECTTSVPNQEELLDACTVKFLELLATAPDPRVNVMP